MKIEQSESSRSDPGESRGTPQKTITDKIDYLRLTVPYNTPLYDLLPPTPSFELAKVNEWGVMGYSITEVLQGGALWMYNPRQQQLKRCLVLGGYALDEMRRDGVELESLLASGRMHDAAFKRLDYARDLRGEVGKIFDLREDFLTGAVTCRAESYNYIESGSTAEHPETLYIGSSDAPRRLRIYDKAGQLKLTDEQWIRFELVLQKRKADPFVSNILTYGYSDAGGAEMADFIQFDRAWAQEVVSYTGLAPSALAPRPDTDPDNFLKYTVMPYLANRWDDFSEVAQWNLFNLVTHKMRGRKKPRWA